jgi:hypothetical protein
MTPLKPSNFDGFASASGYKSDAEWNLIDLIQDDPGFTLLTDKIVVGLLHAESAPTEITGVRCADDSTYYGTRGRPGGGGDELAAHPSRSPVGHGLDGVLAECRRHRRQL